MHPNLSVPHVQVMANRMYRNPLGILLSDYRIRIQFVEEGGAGEAANTEVNKSRKTINVVLP